MKALPILLYLIAGVYAQIWSTGTLSAARYNLACDSGIFAGGRSIATVLNQVDLYNASTGVWSTATLSVGREQLVSANLGTNLVIFAGGRTGTGISNVVEMYDRANGVWSSATLSVARADLASASLDSTDVIFAGGVDTGSAESNVVDRFNGFVWSTATLSAARRDLTGASVGPTRVLFAGGRAAGSSSNVVDLFDGSAWTTATLSVARHALAAVSVGRKTLVAGGSNSAGQPQNVVDLLDQQTLVWTSATLSVVRYNLVAAALDNVAVFAGGITTSLVISNAVDKYDDSTGTWSVATLSRPATALAACSVLTPSNVPLLMFAGGSNVTGGEINTLNVLTLPAVATPPPATTASATPTPSVSSTGTPPPSPTSSVITTLPVTGTPSPSTIQSSTTLVAITTSPGTTPAQACILPAPPGATLCNGTRWILPGNQIISQPLEITPTLVQGNLTITEILVTYNATGVTLAPLRVEGCANVTQATLLVQGCNRIRNAVLEQSTQCMDSVQFGHLTPGAGVRAVSQEWDSNTGSLSVFTQCDPASGGKLSIILGVVLSVVGLVVLAGVVLGWKLYYRRDTLVFGMYDETDAITSGRGSSTRQLQEPLLEPAGVFTIDDT